MRRSTMFEELSSLPKGGEPPSRVNPREVRYCRCDPETSTSSVKKIKMPAGLDEEAKFVCGAMLPH